MGVAEIDVVLASTVVTEPANTAKAKINFLIANADYVPANAKSGPGNCSAVSPARTSEAPDRSMMGAVDSNHLPPR